MNGTRQPCFHETPMEEDSVSQRHQRQVDLGQVLPRIPFDSGGPVGEGISVRPSAHLFDRCGWGTHPRLDTGLDFMERVILWWGTSLQWGGGRP